MSAFDPSEGLTLPHSAPTLGVRALRVEVLEGSDEGRAIDADDEALTVGTAEGNAAVLRDPTVSRYHLELRRARDGVAVHDLGSTNGTYVGAVRVERAVVPAGTTLRVGASTLRVTDGAEARVALHTADALAGLRGRSASMRKVMAQVARAAGSAVSVLVHGESGTGKELVARALHELGPRARGPFVTVDCGALIPTLVASELFGHEKGAFTGAERQHAGAFERADGGTLFLDELGELPAALQAALLGVLERRRFRRVGGKVDLATDVRVVAATHRDLRAEVNAGRFRLDLYYRLAVLTVTMPPLRERAEDLPLLVEHFLREAGHAGGAAALISPAAMTALQAHRWPGNVRELRNLVEATLALGEPPALDAANPGGALASEPAGASARSSEPAAAADGAEPARAAPRELASGDDDALLRASYKSARAAVLERFERRYLAALLERTQGNVSRASREAQMDRSHLTDLLARHRLRE